MATINDTDDRALACYRCGASLDRLTLPLGRLDLCPDCGVELHVCRMCRHFLPSAPRACVEDDAEDVSEKARANFCEYFRPNPLAYDGTEKRAEDRAHDELAALFGDTGRPAGQRPDDEPQDDSNAALERANALFER